MTKRGIDLGGLSLPRIEQLTIGDDRDDSDTALLADDLHGREEPMISRRGFLSVAVAGGAAAQLPPLPALSQKLQLPEMVAVDAAEAVDILLRAQCRTKNGDFQIRLPEDSSLRHVPRVEWMSVCRTDWKDNVATRGYQPPTPSAEDWAKRVRYGARIWEHNGQWQFAVIDSFSDG